MTDHPQVIISMAEYTRLKGIEARATKPTTRNDLISAFAGLIQRRLMGQRLSIREAEAIVDDWSDALVKMGFQ